MGGWGSGRHGSTHCTDDCRSIDARRLARDGLLKQGGAFKWTWTRDGARVADVDMRVDALYVHLTYRYRRDGAAWKDTAYSVALDWTPCHYGSQRAWFRCPAFHCGRRVAILYMGESMFACRHCYRLAYRCQRETADDRATRRAERIRERLRWEPGILNGNGGKPPWMRWATFERLSAEHEALVAASLAMMVDRLDCRSVRDVKVRMLAIVDRRSGKP